MNVIDEAEKYRLLSDMKLETFLLSMITKMKDEHNTDACQLQSQ